MSQFRVKPVETPAEWSGAVAVRMAVFVEEQGVPPEAELDEHDPGATHVVALAGAQDAVVGTGRLVALAGGTGKIGRLAVLPDWRGRGVGSGLLVALEREAVSRGLRRSVLHAQVHATAFYGRHGYGVDATGGTFLEDGILHRRMTKALLPEP